MKYKNDKNSFTLWATPEILLQIQFNMKWKMARIAGFGSPFTNTYKAEDP